MDEVNILRELNDLYIRCVVKADADQFDKILASDFLNSNPDGTVVDKPEFLRRIRAGQPLKSMDIDDVRIRMFGDIGIIHARTTYASADGATGVGRYTDIWSKRDGQWLAVAAHVTRLAGR